MSMSILHHHHPVTIAALAPPPLPPPSHRLHPYLHFHGLKLNTTMGHSCHPQKWLIQVKHKHKMSIQLINLSAAAQLHRISNIWFLFQNQFMAFRFRQIEERDQQVNLDVFLALVLICFAAYVHVFTFEK